MSRLDVLYTCDNNYAPYAGISMTSLFENNSSLDSIRVYLVGDKVSLENRSKLSALAGQFDRELIFIDGEKLSGKVDSLNIPTYRGSRSASFRLFFDSFILPDTERLLYLDCDTLVLSSLEELTTLDMSAKVCGVVRDSLTSRYKKLIGLPWNIDYFNSGVLLIDTERWQSEGITEKIQRHLRNVRSRYCNPDQDILNIILSDKTLILPPEYNLQPVHLAFKYKDYMSAYKPAPYYTEAEISQALAHPKILHTYRFLGDFPWHERNLHPSRAEFEKYKRDSLWLAEESPSKKTSYIFKAERLLYRTLPKALFLSLFEQITYLSFKKKNNALAKEKRNRP